ncbi:MAG: VWA domain-containing protein [Bacteroidales bacterium]|jgi:Ca-activated chloride channel family protein|nr:VWA domain-containing protein [Bacteroidales bacterium]
MINGITFHNPEFLYLLFCLPLLAGWKWWRHKHTVAKISIPNIDMFSGVRKSLRQRLMFLPFVLRLLTLGVLIVALARPQSSLKGRQENIEGVDIMLALDVSGSMLAEDFVPNRLEAAKVVAAEFVRSRPTDRMGIVVFAGESYTQCPLTIDHSILLFQINAISTGMVEDGTAIGDGLATAINRLKNSTAVSKTIILLTDGINNMGSIAPITSAEIASVFGIRVYTIGVGTIGTAPYPFQTPFGKQYQNVEVHLDEPMLKEMAEITGGQYFRATNKNKLKSIFDEIDKMEKSKIEVLNFERKYEEFKFLLWLALGLFLLEILLSYSVLKSIP